MPRFSETRGQSPLEYTTNLYLRSQLADSILQVAPTGFDIAFEHGTGTARHVASPTNEAFS